MKAAAIVASAVGGAGSVALMLIAGRRNPSLVLMLMFVVWVLSQRGERVSENGNSVNWSLMLPIVSLMLPIVYRPRFRIIDQ